MTTQIKFSKIELCGYGDILHEAYSYVLLSKSDIINKLPDNYLHSYTSFIFKMKLKKKRQRICSFFEGRINNAMYDF